MTVSQIIKEMPPPSRFCNPYFHSCFHNIPQFSLSWAWLMQSKSPSCFLKANFNITFPSKLISSKWFLPFSFVHQKSFCISRLHLPVPHTPPIPLYFSTGHDLSVYAASSSLLFIRPVDEQITPQSFPCELHMKVDYIFAFNTWLRFHSFRILVHSFRSMGQKFVQ